MDINAAEAAPDLLECVSLARDQIESKANRVVAARDLGVLTPTPTRFRCLVEQVRPGARARADLDRLDPAMLLAGALALQQRRRPYPAERLGSDGLRASA